MTNAHTAATGAIAPPGGLQGRFWARWRLRLRARLVRRRGAHPVAELIARGEWAALDALIRDLDAAGGGGA